MANTKQNKRTLTRKIRTLVLLRWGAADLGALEAQFQND